MAKTKNSVDFSAENSERVEHFFDVLKKEISDTTEKMIKDAEAEKKKIIAKANEDSLQKAYDDIQGSAKASERKYSLIAAKSELEIKQDILRRRMEITDRIFGNISGRIAEFRKTEKYLLYLKNLLSDEKLSGTEIVYLSSDDMKYEAELRKLCGEKVTFKADKLIKLGGLSVYYPEKSVLVDKTIDTVFGEEKKFFAASGKIAAVTATDNQLN